MEVTGKFLQLLPNTEGESQRGHWIRGGFVIETVEDFPRKMAFTAFGEERVAMAQNIPLGSMVQVIFTPESREYNGRWYTDLRASRVQPMVPGQMPPAANPGYTWNPGMQQPQAAPQAAPQPQAQAAQPFASAPIAPTMSSNEDDDLPF